MWIVVEQRAAAKTLGKLPAQLAEKYAVWLAIIQQSGPTGLRAIKGWHDEKLSGELAHLRSSRLNNTWRIIYRAEATTSTVYVERITAHDY